MVTSFVLVIQTGEKFYAVTGSIASISSFASIVAITNVFRQQHGQPALGYLNPSLYAMDMPDVANDVSKGFSHCILPDQCCPTGVYAVYGWDPVSGLGSVSLDKFLSRYVSQMSSSIMTQSRG